MKKKLAGKIAVVTGGSRGIGAAIAKELGRERATVVINYNGSHKLAQEVVEETGHCAAGGCSRKRNLPKSLLKRFW